MAEDQTPAADQLYRLACCDLFSLQPRDALEKLRRCVALSPGSTDFRLALMEALSQLQLWQDLKQEAISFMHDVPELESIGQARLSQVSASEAQQLEPEPKHGSSAQVSQQTAAPVSPAQAPPQRPRRNFADWSELDLDSEDEHDSEDVNQAPDLPSLLKRIYAQASPEAQRAMLKSYTLSGGTSLSNSWAEVAENDYGSSGSSTAQRK